jgi:branched-chain amino acid transport system substrate-binding protein
MKSIVSRGARLAAVAAAAAALAYAGCVGAADPEGDTIVLGSAVSLTGKYSQEGKDTVNGYNLGVKMINEHGGVTVNGKKYKLEVKYYDDESTAARTAQLFERLINQDGIKFALGPFASGPTKAAAPVIEKYKIPMIAPEGASRSIYSQGYRYIFAPLSTAEQYLTPAVELAAESAGKLGKKPDELRIAMAVEQDPFSLDMRSGVVDEAKKLGVKIVLDDKLPSDLSDLSATLTKLKVLKPDVFIVAGHAKAAATATRQMKELGVDVPIVAITLCEAANLTGKFGDAANGILCPTQWAETLKYQDKLFGTAMDFYHLFKKTYSGYTEVPYQSAQAAAAVEIYADAFERAQSFDPAKVRDAIAATDMETFYGNIKFDPTGRNTGKPMVLRQIQHDKYVVVFPTKYAADPFIVPRSATQ